MRLVSAYMPFPDIGWWRRAIFADLVLLDSAEHYEKMTCRNKYFITGPNGIVQLSVPLKYGREQRTKMGEVIIDNNQEWLKQHWRTIESVYRRTPYFEHYETVLRNFYKRQYTLLADFNLSSVRLLATCINVSLNIVIAEEYAHYYQDSIDIRKKLKRGKFINIESASQPYCQIFSERNGFVPNLSLLDLLFSEGPTVKQWLLKNTDIINNWIK